MRKAIWCCSWSSFVREGYIIGSKSNNDVFVDMEIDITGSREVVTSSGNGPGDCSILRDVNPHNQTPPPDQEWPCRQRLLLACLPEQCGICSFFSLDANKALDSTLFFECSHAVGKLNVSSIFSKAHCKSVAFCALYCSLILIFSAAWNEMVVFAPSNLSLVFLQSRFTTCNSWVNMFICDYAVSLPWQRERLTLQRIIFISGFIVWMHTICSLLH